MFGDRLEIWAEGIKAEAKTEGEQVGVQKGVLIGVQKGKIEGKIEGKQEGEILMLQRLLAKRFGAIPADTVSLISNASVEDIERWADRVFDAKQLSDIFND